MELIIFVVIPQNFFWFQVYKFTVGIIKQIEQSIWYFLWKGKIDQTTTLQVSWKQVCQPNKCGGLAFKSLGDWNLDAIGKLYEDLFKVKPSLREKWMWNNKIKM